MNVEDAVKASLREIPPASVLIAAVSGGADSIAMLSAFEKHRFIHPFTLYVVHINHNLRGAESDADARFVKTLCAKLSLPCKVVKIKSGKLRELAARRQSGIEDAARAARYKILYRQVRRLNAGFILTAHNKNDQIENLLMRVLRGSGPAGLAFMKRRRGVLLRPFLEVSRAGILQYLQSQNLPYRTDSTNNCTDFLRNKVRLILIPFLEANFPGWQSGVQKLGVTQSLVNDFLNKKVKRVIKKHGVKNDDSITIKEFLKLPEILQEEIIFYCYDKLNKNIKRARRKRIRKPRRDALRILINKAPKRADIPNAVLEFKRGNLKILRKTTPLPMRQDACRKNVQADLNKAPAPR